MKRTFPVNISGKVFYIDEDAYQLMQSYLNQLKESFQGEEGEEIVTDIESRIAELFDERIATGANAIVYTDVNRVIEIMGKPSDISNTDNNETDSKEENREAETPVNETLKSETTAETIPVKKKFYRDVNNKVCGGVLSGLAVYFDWDVNILRLLYVVVAVLTYLWPLTIIYLILWMIIPPANTPRRVLEMRGDEVTVDSIGRTILSTATPPPYNGFTIKEKSNVVASVFTFIGKCFMGFIGILGALGAMVATGYALLFLVAVIAATCFSSFEIISWFTGNVTSIVPALAFMGLAICFIIPCIALAWVGASVVFNSRGAAKSTVFLALTLETLFIVATVVLFIYVFSHGI